MHAMSRIALLSSLLFASAEAITVPSTAPSTAAVVDPSLLSVSLEFFAFPGYTQLPATANCLANLATLRGAQPAIRIGGTTQCVSLQTIVYPADELCAIQGIVRRSCQASMSL